MPEENINTSGGDNGDQGGENLDNKVNEAIPDKGGEGAGDSQGVGIKDQLGEALGKEFPDDKTALKAVKDTFSYVGKLKNLQSLDSAMDQLQKVLGTDQKGVIQKVEEITKKSVQEQSGEFVPRAEFDETKFYSQKPEYTPYKKLVETFKKANPDKSREEIIESDDFKEDFEKIKAHDESEKSKSVLKSSPRLGGAIDKISQAKESQRQGKHTEAGDKAVEAVLDAFE